MKRYNIIDEKGYTWCVEKGTATNKETGHTIRNFGHWDHKKFTFNDEDWNKRKVNYLLFTAKIQQFLMKLEGLNTTLKGIAKIK